MLIKIIKLYQQLPDHRLEGFMMVHVKLHRYNWDIDGAISHSRTMATLPRARLGNRGSVLQTDLFEQPSRIIFYKPPGIDTLIFNVGRTSWEIA